MIPAGYLARIVSKRPDWLKVAIVEDVFSVSACVSGDFVDYIPHMRHNDFWLFNSIRDVQKLARDEAVDLSGMTIFYYEIFENQYDARRKKWTPIPRLKIFPTNVEASGDTQLAGFDVVTFFGNSSPECSPLSCNGLAETIPVNCHCLLETFDEAVTALENGKFERGEEGPFRIFAVYKTQI